eukprot:Awhi_evm1s12197
MNPSSLSLSLSLFFSSLILFINSVIWLVFSSLGVILVLRWTRGRGCCSDRGSTDDGLGHHELLWNDDLSDEEENLLYNGSDDEEF